MRRHRSNYPYGIEPPDRERAIGWTHAKMIRFVEILREVPNVTAACRAVGMTKVGAYKLRKRWPSFAEAWQDAVYEGVAKLQDDVFDRARSGTQDPVFYRGEQVGTRTRYHDGLAMLLLKAHDEASWGVHPLKDAPAALMRGVARRGRCRVCNNADCAEESCRAEIAADREKQRQRQRDPHGVWGSGGPPKWYRNS